LESLKKESDGSKQSGISRRRREKSSKSLSLATGKTGTHFFTRIGYSI